MRTQFTSFAAGILALIAIGWFVVAVVVGFQPSWEHLRPFFAVGGLIVLAIAGGIWILARRTPGSE